MIYLYTYRFIVTIKLAITFMARVDTSKPSLSLMTDDSIGKNPIVQTCQKTEIAFALSIISGRR